jgi:hypothetical protein
MLLRKAALILGVLLAVATIGLAAWFWNTQNRLYSSPTAVRKSANYDLAFSAPTNAPPVPTNLYSSFQIDRQTNRIVISSPAVLHEISEKDYAPLSIVHADSSHTSILSNSSIRLAYIGIGSAQPRTNFEWGLEVPATHYTPDAKPLTPAASNELTRIVSKYQRALSFNGSYPESQFIFISSNVPSLKTISFTAFDARTHYPLTSGYSSSSFSSGFYFANDLRIWHQTPIQLVTTIATGPTNHYPIAFSEGAELSYPGGHIRLMLMQNEEDFGSTSSSHDGRSNVVTFTLRPSQLTDPNRKTCSFIFHSWPRANNAPIDFQFLDASGKVLKSYRTGSTGHLLRTAIKCALADVKQIRLVHYPNVYRLVFTIPELPGLPEQNRNIENLFDVHIPYMYFRYEHDFQYQIGHLLQMEQHHFALTFTNRHFPTFRTNTTPRELFTEMEKLLANPNLHLVADPEKNQVAAKPHPIAAAIEAIKTKLRL